MQVRMNKFNEAGTSRGCGIISMKTDSLRKNTFCGEKIGSYLVTFRILL